MDVLGNGIATIIYGVGYYNIVECQNRRNRLKTSIAVAVVEFLYKMFLVYIAKENALNSYRVVFYLCHWILYLGIFKVYLENAYYQFIKCYLCVMAGAAFSSGIFLPIVRAVCGENARMLALSQMNTLADVVLFSCIAMIFIGASIVFGKIKFIWKQSRKISETLFYICLFLECAVSVLVLETKEMSAVVEMLALVIIVFAVIRHAMISKEEIHYMEINDKLRTELQKQYSYYWKISDIQEQIRKVRHDLANHLQIIEGAGAYEEKKIAEKYKIELLELLRGANVLEECPNDKNTESKEIRLLSKYSIRILTICVFAALVSTILWKPENFFIIIKVTLAGAVVSLFLMQSFGFYKVRREKHEKQIIERKIRESEVVSKEWKQLTAEIENSVNSEMLMETITNSKVYRYTGNPVVDIMLQKKCEYCRQEGIEVQLNLSVPKDGQVKDIDIIGILGNAFDNAIEACMRTKKSEKEIQIYSEYIANFWAIRIGNTKNHRENPVRKQFKTRKKDKESHGLGMKIIKETVKKYDGEITVYDEGNEFIMLVMLKIK